MDVAAVVADVEVAAEGEAVALAPGVGVLAEHRRAT